MASILLAGDPENIRACVKDVSEAYVLYTLHDEEMLHGMDRLNRIEAFDQVPEDLSAVLLLATRDDGEIESTLTFLDELLTESNIPLFVNTLFMTATEVSALLGNRIPVVGISWISGLTNVAERLEAAPALQVGSEDAQQVLSLLSTIVPGDIEQVEDRVALVSARILSMIINEAAFALMEDVANPDDIDTAMKLGTNYPNGPLAWVDSIGAHVIVGILQALHNEYGEERYRPCVLLKQYARAGKQFHSHPN